MKYLIFTMACIFTISAIQAQHRKIKSPEDLLKQVKRLNHEQRQRAKTTATYWRLSAASVYEMKATVLTLTDSSIYHYSNGRTSVFDTENLDYYDYGVDPQYNQVFADTVYKYSDKGAGFERNERYISEYDNANRRTSFTEQTGSSLTNASKELALYNANGDIERETYLDWNSGQMKWDTSYSYFYTYDAQNRLLVDSGYDFDANTPDYKATYVYNANGDVIESEFYTWNGSALMPFYKALFQYDANNRQENSIFQVYVTGNWVNYAKDTTAYAGTGNARIYYAQSLWDSVKKQWINGIEQQFTLNSNSMPILIKASQWDTAQKKWIQYMEVGMEYNTNDLVTKVEAYEVTNGTRASKPRLVGHYYYEHYFKVGIDKTAAATVVLKVYPNPARDILYIETGGQAGTVSISNLYGQVLTRQKAGAANKRSELTVSGFAPGNYILHFQPENGKASSRVIAVQ